MTPKFLMPVLLGGLALAGCGGSGAPSAPPVSPVASPQPASAAATSAKPAASAAQPAASAPKPAASASASGQANQLKTGFTAPSAVNDPLYVAEDDGFFARNGLDVAPLQLIKDTAVPPALMSNELDFIVGGGNELVNADLNGSSLVMTATASDYPIFSLFADKKYKTVQDLVGQKVGITSPGAAADAAAHLFLSHYNLLDKVKLEPTGTVPAILAAMGKNLIAGGILSPPTTFKAQSQGFVELVNGVKLGDPMTHAGMLFTRDYLTTHKDVAQRVLKAYAQAWAYCADPANKATVVQAIAKYTDSNIQDATDAYETMLPVWRKKPVPTVDPAGIAEVLKLTDNPKAHDIKPEQLIDNTIIQAVAS
jgi:NitT/TauT family transport system substrate-binding protein